MNCEHCGSKLQLIDIIYDSYAPELKYGHKQTEIRQYYCEECDECTELEYEDTEL